MLRLDESGEEKAGEQSVGAGIQYNFDTARSI
jgi:hypothetical protein